LALTFLPDAHGCAAIRRRRILYGIGHCHIARQPPPPASRAAIAPDPFVRYHHETPAKTPQIVYPRLASGLEVESSAVHVGMGTLATSNRSVGTNDVRTRLPPDSRRNCTRAGARGRRPARCPSSGSWLRVRQSSCSYRLLSDSSASGKSSSVKPAYTRVLVPAARRFVAVGKFDQYNATLLRDPGQCSSVSATSNPPSSARSERSGPCGAHWRRTWGPSGQLLLTSSPNCDVPHLETRPVQIYRPAMRKNRRFPMFSAVRTACSARKGYPLALFPSSMILQWLMHDADSIDRRSRTRRSENLFLVEPTATTRWTSLTRSCGCWVLFARPGTKMRRSCCCPRLDDVGDGSSRMPCNS